MDKLPKSLTRMECYYLDHKLVSKDYINKLPALIKLDNNEIGNDIFILTTCLRYEIYNFSGKKLIFLDKKKFAFVSGSLCQRRFISLLCGLQSEIIGEKEIFLQAQSAIYDVAQSKKLSKKLFWDINVLFDVARQIRNKYSITQPENYSTVGANLLNEKIENPSVIAIIGGGYMAESFFKNINTAKIKKVIWINRNIDKAKAIAKGFKEIPQNVFEFYNFENAERVICGTDFIFAAVHKCGGLFSSLRLEKTKCVVDISYPALFSDKVGCEFYSINNTYFEKFLKNPVSKESVVAVEKEIDNLIFKLI